MTNAEMNPILRYDRRPTRKNAINAMCAHCMGCTREELEVGFRNDVKNCASTECPLHRFRPFQSKGEVDAIAHTA